MKAHLLQEDMKDFMKSANLNAKQYQTSKTEKKWTL